MNQGSVDLLPLDQPTLDRSLVRGIAWTVGVRAPTQLLTWASTLIVTRLLTPDDYGLVGMASIFLGLVTLLNEFGLGLTIVTLRELDDAHVAQINGLSIIFGFAAFALSCVAAIPLGHLFGEPRLPYVIVALSVALIISGFRTVPLALLEKKLRFRRLALIDGSQALVHAAGAITFASVGLGYWALVAGNLLGATVAASLVLASCVHWIAWPRFRALGSVLTFSWHVIVSRISWYIYSNADFFIVGRMLGTTALGTYGLAWSLASVPLDKITALVSNVTPAYFAAVKSDQRALRRYLLNLTNCIAIITFPAALGLALVADDFVLVALGSRWEAAIGPLRLLGLYTSFRSILPFVTQVLNAIGESRFAMFNGLVAALVMPVAFYFASSWGTVAVAASWLLVHPLVTFPLYRRLFNKIHVAAPQYLVGLWPSLSGGAMMVMSLLAVRYGFGGDINPPLRLALDVVVGATTYLLTMFVLHRKQLVDAYVFLRHAV